MIVDLTNRAIKIPHPSVTDRTLEFPIETNNVDYSTQELLARMVMMGDLQIITEQPKMKQTKTQGES